MPQVPPPMQVPAGLDPATLVDDDEGESEDEGGAGQPMKKRGGRGRRMNIQDR